MIYINENSGTINVPRHTFTDATTYTMVVNSNLSNEVVLVEDGGNISTNTLYYKFALDNLSSLNIGEYTYKLYDESGSILEIGLLTYGEFERTVIVNNTFNKEKIQYNG